MTSPAKKINELDRRLERVSVVESVMPTATPTASKVPIADASGTLLTWIPQYYSSTNITLADDAATYYTPPSILGVILINGRVSTYAQIFGMANFRTTSSVYCVSMLAGTAFAVTTGVLAGTTGVDGKFTVSPHTDGRIYIENRFGASVNFAITYLGA